MTRWLFVGKPAKKKNRKKKRRRRTGSESWPVKSDMVPRTLKFSNNVVKAGMKTTGKGSPAAKGPIVNRTMTTPEIRTVL